MNTSNVWRTVRSAAAALPVLCLLLSFAIHNGFNAGRAWQLGLVTGAVVLCRLVAAQAHNKLLFAVGSLAAIALGGCVSYAAAIIVLLIIVMDCVYALPPCSFANKPVAGPVFHTIINVWAPYALGLAALNILPADADSRWIVGLYLLFVGRSIVAGVATRSTNAKQKPSTLAALLGKNTTIMIGLGTLILGNAVVIWQVHSASWMVMYMAAYAVAIANAWLMLRRAGKRRDEQFLITLGSREYLGMLLTLLASYIAYGLGCSVIVVAISAGIVTALMFSYYLFSLTARQY